MPQCSVALIAHLEADRAIDYKLAVRENLLKDNVPQYVVAISTGTPLGLLKSSLGLKDATKILSVMIAKFVGAFNVSKNMTPDQIQDLAITWIEEESGTGSFDCPAYRLEDFALFFEMAKTGKYGRPFDYVDAALINQWLDLYHSDRVDKFRQDLRNKEIERNKITPEEQSKIVSPEKMKELFDPIIAQLKDLDKPKEFTEQELEEQEKRRQRMLENRRAMYDSDYAKILNEERRAKEI